MVVELAAVSDAGTAADEPPGQGPNQASSQSRPNTGQEETATVRRVIDVYDSFEHPDVAEVIRVTMLPMW